MNGVLGMADLLLDTPLQPDQRDMAEAIRSSGDALVTIINEILDLSKIESGRLELEETEFTPTGIAGECVRLLTPRAQKKGLTLAVDIGDGGSRHLRGDAGRFRQVLLNLLGNAIKFTEQGHVTLRLSCGDDGSLVAQVADTGMGMTADQLSRLFQPYAQAEASIARRFGGTGLGLTISRRICQAMGGEVTAESELGRGSVFTATFRFRRSLAAPTASASATAVTVLRGTVLVADDSEINRRIARAMCQRLGLRVVEAADGVECLDAVARGGVDLILMDGSMPRLDGYEATTALRSEELATSRSRIPVIGLTANALTGERERCLALGMDSFLAKPFAFVDLAAELARWLPAAEPQHAADT
ncbi:MAG: response regulator [Planctomycetes bacterium]|nr:response regulator [Planctomycetota bacterium]